MWEEADKVYEAFDWGEDITVFENDNETDAIISEL